MRALDVIISTLDHCDRLWEARATRSAHAVFRIARRAFVRSDYASWFEHQFGNAIPSDRDALAGLLLCFSLAVHSRFPYKRLAVPNGLSVILERWVDPAPHHHPIFSKYILSEDGPLDHPLEPTGALGNRAFTPPPLDCHFLGVYCPNETSTFDISSVYVDIERGPSTVLLIGPSGMIDAALTWFKKAGPSLVINRPFGPDPSLRLLYYSAR
jgi:hypothetical protein